MSATSARRRALRFSAGMTIESDSMSSGGVAEFLKRLGEARPVASHDGAFSLVRDTLNGVEDQFSGVGF